jgi:hypothetical protein
LRIGVVTAGFDPEIHPAKKMDARITSTFTCLFDSPCLRMASQTLLAPVVLGMIRQQHGTTRLEPGKVAGLLANQKDNIAAAMPSGLSKLLAGTGLLDSLGDAARTATAATEDAARTSASAFRTVGGTAQRTAAAASGAGSPPAPPATNRV